MAKKKKVVAEEAVVEKPKVATPAAMVSKEKYDAVVSALNEVLDRSVLDVSQKNYYKKKAGI